jgi:putative metallohydrolase (TIGR04338 family)
VNKIDQTVYDCEDRMLAEFGDRRFDSLADIRQYVRILTVQDWFRKRWPQKMRFTVRNGRGLAGYATCRTEDGFNFVVSLPRARYAEFIVLHEIAHACVWNDCLNDHGLIFREALAYMVRQRMGRAQARFLLDAWAGAGLAIP